MTELIITSVRSAVFVSSDNKHLTITKTTPHITISRMGTQGIQGVMGIDGSVWHVGAGGPPADPDIDTPINDLWLDPVTGEFWLHEADGSAYGTWSFKGVLQGRDGDDGLGFTPEYLALLDTRIVPWTVADGAADALTVNFVPDFVQQNGKMFRVRALLANATTTPTLSIDGAAAGTIVKHGDAPLLPGDIAGPMHELMFVIRDEFPYIKYELLNPAGAQAAAEAFASAADAAHAAAADPHPQYLTAAEVSTVGDLLFDPLGSAAAAQTAAQTYADGLVVGLVDDRGNHEANSNTFPTTGGSGTAGAILKGDLWTISAPGTLGGVVVTPGDLIRALVDAPGSTLANWAITENNFGYVAENSGNKTNTIDGSSTSAQYPSAQATHNALTLKQDLIPWTTPAGTADALTANFAPDFVQQNGKLFRLRALLANATATPTLSIDGGAANTIVKNGDQPLVPGDIAGIAHELLFAVRDEFSYIRYELLNPASARVVVEDAIVNGVLDKAPSQNAVFDALAGKETAGAAAAAIAAHTGGSDPHPQYLTAAEGVAAFDPLGAAALSLIPWTVATGTADDLTATYTPALAGSYDGKLIRLRASYPNTVPNPTLTIFGLGAGTIVKNGSFPLLPGDIAGPLHELLLVIRDESAYVEYELINPSSISNLLGTGVFGADVVKSVTQLDHNLLPGTPITKSGTNWVKSGSLDVNGTCVGLAFGVQDANTFTYTTIGRMVLTVSEWAAITGEVEGLVPNHNYFLSTVPGMLTRTPPVTGIKQFVLFAENAITAIFNPGEPLDVTPGTFISGPDVADHATTADRWLVARNLALTGVVTGNVDLDGTADVDLATFIADDALTIAMTAGLVDALADMQDGVDSAVAAGTSNRKLVNQVGHGFVPGTPLSKTGLLWYPACADSGLNTAVVFVAEVLSPDSFTAISGGWMTLTAGQWAAVMIEGVAPTAGEYAFLSLVPGKCTMTPPEEGIKQGMFSADTATTVLVVIEPPVDLTAGSLGDTWFTLRKPSITSRASTTVLAADPDLQFNCVAGRRYTFRGVAYFTPGAGAFSYALDFSGIESELRLYSNQTADRVEFDGTFIATNTGVFSLNWAQTASNAAATSVHAGSFIEYLRS